MSGYDAYSHNYEISGRANNTIYIPPDMEEMFFLGTHKKEEPINIRCGKCHYSGPSEMKKEKGLAYGVTAVVTLGMARHKAMEIHHYCPQCKKDVAYSKPI